MGTVQSEKSCHNDVRAVFGRCQPGHRWGAATVSNITAIAAEHATPAATATAAFIQSSPRKSGDGVFASFVVAAIFTQTRLIA